MKYSSKIKLYLISCLLMFNVHASDYLSIDERSVLESKAINGDVISSKKLAYFYTFTEYDFEKKLYWNEISLKNGSITAMINYSFAATLKTPDKYPDAKRYLQLLSSIGILISKKFLISYCDQVQSCEYSIFHDLIYLNIRDAKEYSSTMMCYVSKNIQTFTKEELTVILAIYQENKSFYSSYNSCGESFYSDNVLKYIERNNNQKLFVNIVNWLSFNKKFPNASTEIQEEYLASQNSIDER